MAVYRHVMPDMLAEAAVTFDCSVQRDRAGGPGS